GAVPLCRAQSDVRGGVMIDRTPVLDAACHAILIAGALLICLPLYFAFVASSLTISDVMRVPMPVLPGGEFFTNLSIAWTRANLGHLMLNSLIVALGITIGKIIISILSAFAITYFRVRFRMTAFWLIFTSLMLPVEVRIVPTYEAVANAALPLQWLID